MTVINLKEVTLILKMVEAMDHKRDLMKRIQVIYFFYLLHFGNINNFISFSDVQEGCASQLDSNDGDDSDKKNIKNAGKRNYHIF